MEEAASSQTQCVINLKGYFQRKLLFQFWVLDAVSHVSIICIRISAEQAPSYGTGWLMLITKAKS